METYVRSLLFFIFGILFTTLSIYFLRPPRIQPIVKKCIYNVTPVLRPMCQSNEKTVCSTLDEVTTYLPCFPSTLIDADIACHDSYSCQEQSKMTKINLTTNVHRKAFFSALYIDNNYLQGAMILGYTLKKYHPHFKMYIMYLENALSSRTLCSLREVGWIPRPVQNIPPPMKGHLPNFVNQFTKLTLWNMTEFDSIVYLDLDTVVLDDISYLHELVADPSRTRFEFAAVADNWYGAFAYHFNAGVLVLHPSIVVFKELIRTMSLEGNYHPTMAEQAFLNAFFQLRYLQLPLIYNVNIAMYSTYPALWKRMKKDFKIVHFTLAKPFLSQSNSANDVPLQIYNEVVNEYMKTNVPNLVKDKCV